MKKSMIAICLLCAGGMYAQEVQSEVGPQDPEAENNY